MAYDIPTRFHKVSEKSDGHNCAESGIKIIIIIIIIIIIRNRAKVICLTNYVWEPYDNNNEKET
jgi:hypothetical protein